MSSTAILNVRIFDGESIIAENGYILFSGSLISEVGSNVPASFPPSTTTVHGKGHTVLPGLIDAHVHVNKGTSELSQCLKLGVTTVLDMFNEPEHIKVLKEQCAHRNDIADLKSACHAATVKDGWPRPILLMTLGPTQEVIERISRWPELDHPDQANDFIKKSIEQGSDYIKLMQESGGALKVNALPVPSLELQTAVVNAAHSHGLITLAHALTQKDTLTVLAAGTDGLAHCFSDEAPTDDLVAAYRRNNSFLVPTLVVTSSSTGEEKENTQLHVEHPTSRNALNREGKSCFCERMMMATQDCKVEYAYQTVKMLKKAGLDIIAGTDTATGLRGTAFGLSLHQELSLYTSRCDFTPVEALRSATSSPARRFKLLDRGRITQGLKADLLMVKGDPTKDISCTLDISGVWRNGIRLL